MRYSSTRSVRHTTPRTTRIIAVVILICASAGSAYANERALVWMRLYRRAQSLSDRLVLMQSATRNPSAEMIPMLLEAITELSSTREQHSSTTERLLHTELSKTVVRAIGDMAAAEAAEAVFDIARSDVDPYLRGEAILTLGRIGARTYADDIAIMLRNLNFNLGTELEDTHAEVLAWASVLALERFREPVGLSSLFFASIGWYSPSSHVREKAAEVMQELVSDPSDVLRDLVRLEPDPEVKLEALRAELRSEAPPERKAEVAGEALRQGLMREPRNVSEATVYNQLRLTAMETLVSYPYASDRTLEHFEEVLSSRGFDVNERITAILAIGAQGTDESAGVLIRFLRQQNQRQLAGVTPADYRIIRTTIGVLGELGIDRAVEELLAVGISNWPPSIVRDAEEALEKIER